MIMNLIMLWSPMVYGSHKNIVWNKPKNKTIERKNHTKIRSFIKNDEIRCAVRFFFSLSFFSRFISSILFFAHTPTNTFKIQSNIFIVSIRFIERYAMALIFGRDSLPIAITHALFCRSIYFFFSLSLLFPSFSNTRSF